MTLKQALDRLTRGGRRTPDEIARFLDDVGFLGIQGDCESCPVARFLGAVLDRRCQVGNNEIVVFHRHGRSYEQIRTPKAVRKFISYFDHDKYPKLKAL
jgi:hypothetical protein